MGSFGALGRQRVGGRLGVLVVGLLLVGAAACGSGQSAGSAAASKPAAAPPAAGGSSGPASSAPAAATPVRLKTAYTTAGATMASVWLAAEDGGFSREGLDAELSFIAAGQAILGALSSQEVPIVIAGANQVVEANLKGGDYVVLGAVSPYLTNSVWVHPSIQRPEDLRGKTIGVSNFGAISHVSARLGLASLGLEEGRDYGVVRSGGTPETLAAMESGAIGGGSFSPPQSFRARDLGYREMIDTATLKIEFGSGAIISTRRYVAEHPDVVERYLRGVIRGAHAFKTRKDAAVDSIMRNARIDERPVAEETWAYFRDTLSDDLVMSPRAIENNLRLLADDEPAARTARTDQFLDSSFVERIKASGFVERVKQGE